MATIGERLRHAREQRGLTLGEVAGETRIQRWILEDIERDDLSRVPCGVFIRGYLLSFAKTVGIDGEELWADYRSELAPRTAEPDATVVADVPTVGPWTLLRAAAVVLVLAVVWTNIRRTDSDVPPPLPVPAEERATDILPATATVGTVAPEPVQAVVSTKPDAVVPAPVAKKPAVATAVVPASQAVTEAESAAGDESAQPPPASTRAAQEPVTTDATTADVEALSEPEPAPGDEPSAVR